MFYQAFLVKAMTGALALASVSHGLNILVGNDDGFGASNIRELYRLLNAAGHNAWMVAPATDQSGMGGRFVLTTSPNLTAPSEFDLIPAGAPSLGHDPYDSHIWYYNGTPGACTTVALDYVLPTFAPFSVPDLLVSGPNFGDNVGTWVFTGSGTIGATYTAVERNIPGIAFSASNPTASYKNTTWASTRAAELSVELVNQLAANTPAGERILPLGYGLNVNYPPLNSSCTNPPFVQSRITGGAGMPKAAYNASTGLVGIAGGDYFGIKPPGSNQCYNGNCSLPGESVVVTSCASSVSIFTVDYDAPRSNLTKSVHKKLSI